MAAKNKEALYDYNIYKIPHSRYDEFVEYMTERHFEEIPLKESLINTSSSVDYTLLYCDKNNKQGSSWVKLLSDCSEFDLVQDVKIYGAALICMGSDFCFVVSYGNAHFYVGRFCDYNFGVEVAERLLNLDSVKSQQNVSHRNKLSKTHFDYLRNTPITYGSGEIPTYIKGKSHDADAWGATINCGTSAQFKWTETPLQIGDKLSALDAALKVESTVKLPRLTPLDDFHDVEKIGELYTLLAESIRDYCPTQAMNYFSVPSFYLLGTKIMQTDFLSYKLTCCRKGKEYDGELSIAVLRDFMNEKNLDVIANIRKINIAVEYHMEQWSASRPIVEYMEFITEDNFCLRNGKWCSFNPAYVERVLQDIGRLAYRNNTDGVFKFEKNSLIEYAQRSNIYVDGDKQPYETYYNEQLAELLSATCQHPSTSKFEEGQSYHFEPCDFFTTEKLYFVKIGQPNHFALAIDQASLTLEKIKSNGDSSITMKDGITIKPSTFVLVLAFDKRKNVVSEWSKINSLNFLIHLNDLRIDLLRSNIVLEVEFSYEEID
jgi:uncharacterized protein (TIGR04141 family)